MHEHLLEQALIPARLHSTHWQNLPAIHGRKSMTSTPTGASSDVRHALPA
jgi:hypothetical protein